MCMIYKSNTKAGEAVQLKFKLTQHTRDEQLMRSLIKYLGCGSLYKDREAFEYRIAKFSDIENKIIPFFNILKRPASFRRCYRWPDRTL